MSAPSRFHPGSIGAFRVTDRSFDEDSRTLSLGYALDDRYSFVETITFETPPPGRARVGGPGLERAVLHLHIAAGTSYYKLAAPGRVVVERSGLLPPEREFHRHLYDDGLREFAVTNGLAVPLAVQIEDGGGGLPPPEPPAADRPGGLLVPIGGGKDSMVLIEAFKPFEPRLFAVNPHPLVVQLAQQSGLELLVVRRRLSPRLGELNAVGGLNGHVPITAIISLIAVVGSFLYGYDTIAMAVERSASEETVVVDGVSVNHQYSKSLEFERLLQDLVGTSIDAGLTYFSALRPYSELAIARAFSRLTEYHAAFCSCNAVFRGSAGPDDGWCGDCPKCRFVALVLAPFMDPGAVAAVIGRDLFDDPGQIGGFAALMSDADKPFECVGERRESAAAMRLLSSLPEWRDKVVVAALSDRARSLVTDDDVRDLLAPGAEGGGDRADLALAVRHLLTDAA
jgi:hypothetical protein